MRQGRKNVMILHLQEKLGIYLLVCAVITAGIITGALSVRLLEERQISDLNQVIFSFVDYLNGQEPLNQVAILQRSLLQNGIFVFLFWLCGNFFFGFIIALALVFYRGFTIGFTVGFLVQQNALRGVIFASAAILPQNLLFVPTTIVAGVFAVSYSLLLLRRRVRRGTLPYGTLFMQYTFAMMMVGLCLVAGTLVETVVTPVLMRVVVSLL